MLANRTLLALTAIAVGLVLAFASPASAQEEEPDIDHASEECIEILEEGGAIDDCQEAPNPLLPETNEIIWGALGFIVVFGFIWRFGLPAIREAMNNRTEKIRSDL